MPQYIGLSGVARSGKNLFATIARKQLNDKGLSCQEYSLAHQLKAETESFLRNTMNLDVWTQNTEEKALIRPFLVAVGDIQRKLSQGKRLTDILNNKFKYSSADVILITDIRYAEYPEDEVHWIKNVLNGKLIHISRYDFTVTNEPFYILPANDNERRNDPLVKNLADNCCSWVTIKGKSDAELIDDEYMNRMVSWSLSEVIKI